jgi:hypothetical protein
VNIVSHAMTGRLGGASARAANGHVNAAPPVIVMNSRRRMWPPRTRHADFESLTLLRTGCACKWRKPAQIDRVERPLWVKLPHGAKTASCLFLHR